MNAIRHIFRKEEGIAYLEFALCLPLLLALLMGSIEVTRYILIAQKVNKIGWTISDVVGQGQTIGTSDLNNIIYAAGQIMQPYTFTTNGYVVISSVTQTGAYGVGNPPVVSWQYTGGGTWTQASKIGTTSHAATLPTGLTLNSGDNVIVTEVFYNYQPLIPTDGILSGGMIYQYGIFRPRLGALSTLGP